MREVKRFVLPFVSVLAIGGGVGTALGQNLGGGGSGGCFNNVTTVPTTTTTQRFFNPCIDRFGINRCRFVVRRARFGG